MFVNSAKTSARRSCKDETSFTNFVISAQTRSFLIQLPSVFREAFQVSKTQLFCIRVGGPDVSKPKKLMGRAKNDGGPTEKF